MSAYETVNIRRRKTPPTLDQILTYQQRCFQRHGSWLRRLLVTQQQQESILDDLQRQVRFMGNITDDKRLKWNGIELVAK